MITTNILDREALCEQITERTVSRLTEMCDELPLLGHDHRHGAAPDLEPLPARPRTLTRPMPGIVIVGAQWGDEGKGKITDLLAERADAVVRFQGGNNAGHTIVRDGADVEAAPDAVGDPAPGQAVRDRQRRRDRPEGADRRARRAAAARASTRAALRISANAHLIMPYHLMLDHAGETKLGKLQIGTTRRGIGPCYADKAARLGIRVQDLLDEKILKKKIVAALEPKRLSLRPFARDPRLDLQTMTEEYLTYGHRLEQLHRRHQPARARAARRRRAWSCSRARRARCSTSTTAPIRSSPRRTRSRAPRASAPASGPKDIDEVWGITKAYTTRVGAGPFPTELEDALADELRERGGEYGTTTGRPRRVGWLDLVALRYAARLNSLTALAITKLDVLSGVDRCRRLHALPRRRRAPSSTTSPTTRPCSTTRSASTRSCRAGARTSASAAARASCPTARARLPAVHRRLRQGADRADRRRPGPRRGDLDRGRQRDDARRRRSGAADGARRRQRLAPALEQVLVAAPRARRAPGRPSRPPAAGRPA